MSQVYVRLLAVLVAAAAFAACGGGDDEPTRIGESDGLATYEVESSGFSIGVPTAWQAVNADEAFTEETLDSMREADPELAPFIDAIAAPDSPIKLVAIDPDAEEGFATNLNVVVERPPASVTREQYFDASTAQLESFDLTEFDEELVELPAGEALHITYEDSRGGVDQPLAVAQYVLFENGTGFTLTYTTLAAALASHRDDFEESARSFRIG
jgi:hypothetical protein